MDINSISHQDILRVRAKPNAKKTEILSIAPDATIHLAVAAPPEDNKANIEILKFFTRALKKRVKLIGGATSKEKVLRIVG